MLRFELAVAIALFGGALCSATVFAFASKEGGIRLPVYDREEYEGGSDPFDVLMPEDIVDGFPIDEAKFWARMRVYKLFLAFLLSLVLVIEAISLGFTFTTASAFSITNSLLRVSFHVYTVVLTARSITQQNVTTHTQFVLHLGALMFLAALLELLMGILPPSTTRLSFFVTNMPVSRLWSPTTVLTILIWFLSFSIPTGPDLHYPPSLIYSPKTVSASTHLAEHNVSGVTGASIWSHLLFSYTTKVVMLGYNSTSLEIGDLPIVPGYMRATYNFLRMRLALRTISLPSWPFFLLHRAPPAIGSGWTLAYRLLRLNWAAFAYLVTLASVSAGLFYAPAFFLQQLVEYLERDPKRERIERGWRCLCGLFGAMAILYLLTGQLWSLSLITIPVRLRIQLNTSLFAKTLVRKDVASSVASSSASSPSSPSPASKGEGEGGGFSSKAQIMTLMTTDVDRVCDFASHLYSLVDSPIEIFIGTIFLYKLLGVSCFFGLAVTCVFLPLNRFAGTVVVGAQENLMKARDERIALMNEILGGIRMIKFMAWERRFEKRVQAIRNQELKYQKLNYNIETLWNCIWNTSPIVVTLVSFWHFTVIRGQVLTPSIAFTSISVFNELKFVVNALPETFVSMLQSFVSLGRLEKYLNGTEVAAIPPLSQQSKTIALQSATVTWSQDRLRSSTLSGASTPGNGFSLRDLSLQFPEGELSLICGKLGSGKTLLLLSLLGEADLLAGQIQCPRTPPDALASFAGVAVPKEKWIVEGICAYVPQAAWLRNASIKENILFTLPYDEERYQKTLEVCALVSDLKILEDGDESEIGEQGVNLSGGQKARVSLARAVYSRASILLLDDLLSAVDAHTAHHLYHECLKGDLMRGRTVILVSHHVGLCASGAAFIVALDNGRVQFQGDRKAFLHSSIVPGLIQPGSGDVADEDFQAPVERVANTSKDKASVLNLGISTPLSSVIRIVPPAEAKKEMKPARKLVEEERRAAGRIGRDIWLTYFRAAGDRWYWVLLIAILVVAAVVPVAENKWLEYWSRSAQAGNQTRSPLWYINIYALVNAIGLVVKTIPWFVFYHGSIHASSVLYKHLLETVLFTNIRFHDTVSRGRLLNRFGKDFEGIDSSLANSFGRTVMYGLSAITAIVTVCVVGGLPFLLSALAIGILYWNIGKVYGQTSRDMRRLDSVTRSLLYSIYGETISGITVLRAFGASSKFLRDMLRCVDTNCSPYYWMWGVNRWLSARFNLLSGAVVGITGLVAILNPRIDAALAGFALAFASTITKDLILMVRRFVSLEQSMVALERVKEYTEIDREPPEFIEPSPPQSWPSEGAIHCEDLVVRYAPDLPDVLHKLNFEIHPGEKIGILGRTGSGKSTLALSLFRFVEPCEGFISVDGVDIAKIGLTDLRNRLTIIPQDPTILSGTLRTTLDVCDEYEDAEIFEALRRVHLIPSDDDAGEEAPHTADDNIFRNLDSLVSESGENFSTGEKQLLCMARAILKRSKVLVMDEATASVDYATDELISKTIRQEFASSTVLTIAHRLRTVIDYDRVMFLEEGQIMEFDRPATLLSNPSSMFYLLCKATGKTEFSRLRKMAGV